VEAARVRSWAVRICSICFQSGRHTRRSSLLLVFRWHRSITDVDAACCYRPNSVLYRSVCLSQLWALQKRLNRSRCRFSCWLGCAQGTMY